MRSGGRQRNNGIAGSRNDGITESLRSKPGSASEPPDRRYPPTAIGRPQGRRADGRSGRHGSDRRPRGGRSARMRSPVRATGFSKTRRGRSNCASAPAGRTDTSGPIGRSSPGRQRGRALGRDTPRCDTRRPRDTVRSGFRVPAVGAIRAPHGEASDVRSARNGNHSAASPVTTKAASGGVFRRVQAIAWRSARSTCAGRGSASNRSSGRSGIGS